MIPPWYGARVLTASRLLVVCLVAGAPLWGYTTTQWLALAGLVVGLAFLLPVQAIVANPNSVEAAQLLDEEDHQQHGADPVESHDPSVPPQEIVLR